MKNTLPGIPVLSIALAIALYSSRAEGTPGSDAGRTAVSGHAENHQDTVVDDNIAESSVTSYSSVVIHHPSKGRATAQWSVSDHRKDNLPVAPVSRTSQQGADPDDKEQGPVSESYFKVFNPAPARIGHNLHSVQDMGIQQVEPPAYAAPPGMSRDLMSTLLKQQPQTFDHLRTAETDKWADYESQRTDQDTGAKKKYQPEEKAKKRQKPQQQQQSSFNVGYSIGFGQQQQLTQPQQQAQQTQQQHRATEASQDVVMGKPKPFRIHVKPPNTVWKEVEPGVEMSQDVENRQPFRMNFDHHFGSPQLGLLNGQSGQSVFYLNGLGHPEINAVPTGGQSTFDHAHALGQSNPFDFSNAMDHPILLPKTKSLQGFPTVHDSFHKTNLESNFHKSLGSFPLDFGKHSFYTPSKQQSFFSVPQSPYYPQTHYKSNLDLMNHYYGSEFGMNNPVPIQNVFIPGSKQGEGRMVQAIVIPISQIQGFENYNYGGGEHAGATKQAYHPQPAGGYPPPPTANYPPPPTNGYPAAKTNYAGSSPSFSGEGHGQPAVQAHTVHQEATTSRPHTRNGFGTKLTRHPGKQVGPEASQPSESSRPPMSSPPTRGGYKAPPGHDPAFRQKNPAQMHRDQQIMLNSIMAQEMIRKNPTRSVPYMFRPPALY